jgi:uncharacterized protein YcfL
MKYYNYLSLVTLFLVMGCNSEKNITMIINYTLLRPPLPMTY